MKLQEILQFKGIDLSKTKLIRHNISNEIIKNNYERKYLDIYQSIQQPTLFKNCETVISFLGTEGTTGVFLGCYEIKGYSKLKQNELPEDFCFENEYLSECVFWNIVKTDILNDLTNRLVIEWGKSTRGWCQNGTTEKEVLHILPAVSEISFISYDKVLLSYEKLKMIVNNIKNHKEWETKLSAVAGIYLITDTKTGKQYVGSASGENGGIWGRWSEYVKTKHGGNKKLIELINIENDYCRNFQFSILEVFPIKRDKNEILEYEALYKKKICTVEFGLNDN